MSAPRGCSVCRDPRAPEIDAELAKACPNRAVGTRYGLGRMAIQRHRVNHRPERLRSAAKAHQGEPATDILERLRVFHKGACDILDKAVADGRPETALKALGEIRKQLELEGRLLGLGELAPTGGGNTFNVVVLDAETGSRMAQMYLQRHGKAAPALPPPSIESKALEPTGAAARLIQESA